MLPTDQGQSGPFLEPFKENPLATFQVIEKIGISFSLNHEIVTLQGQGKYSTVYKALNKITDNLVAIKVFPSQYSSISPNDIDFLQNLDHPFIEKLLDAYITEEQVWLVTDYCQLGSIFDIMSMTNQPLSEAEISCVCYSILYALDYIHTFEKVHGGIKTTNILVNSTGQIRLADFGSAIWVDPDQSEELDNDTSVDIWSLGICVLEMIEGVSKVYETHRDQEANSFVKQSSKHTPQLLEDPYTEDLKDFIGKCLQPNPRARPKASRLFDHPLIVKYKGDLPQIRKKFYKEKMEKITEFKKSMILQSQRSRTAQQKPTCNGVSGEENIPDESDFPNITVEEIAQRLHHENTIDCTLGSDNYLTFIEKPSFNLTDGPSRIELTNRNVIYMNTCPDPRSNIKHQRGDQSSEQEIEWTPRTDQLSVISPSPRLDFTSEKKNVIVPPLKLPIPYRGKMPTIASQYSSENTNSHSKANQEDVIKPFTSIENKTTSLNQRPIKPKMYKATNDSNFVVKHKFSMTTMNTHLNYSIDTETTLNPITLDRQKQNQAVNNSEIDSTRELIEGLENLKTNIPRISAKEMTASTVADSKGSSCFKSVFHTPNPSDSRKSVVLKGVKENLEKGTSFYTGRPSNITNEAHEEEKVEVEAERLRLEEQMKKELEQIKKKYSNMLKTLN